MLNHYETVFITTPVLSEIQVKEAVENSKTLLPRMEVISSMKRLGDCASWLILSKRKLQVFITCFNSRLKVL